MRVYIGPYPKYFGPYDVAELLKFVGVSENRRDEIGAWLNATWFGKLLRRMNDKHKRKINVRIDNYDTWSMDHTLAIIILPMLKQLRDTTHGSAMVDDEDVPEYLRSTNAPAKQEEWDVDYHLHPRWEWALDEMIWTFDQLANYDYSLFFNEDGTLDKNKTEAYDKRIKHGLMMFGKYYRSLWD
jgi:hypothetical protein